jgi:hypothetical protein
MGEDYDLVEAKEREGDCGAGGVVYLYDRSAGTVQPLDVITHGAPRRSRPTHGHLPARALGPQRGHGDPVLSVEGAARASACSLLYHVLVDEPRPPTCE